MAGVSVEAHKLRHQRNVADTARTYGFEVTVEPGTERLVEPGFSGTTKLAYAGDEPLDPVRDLASESAKDEFTARVL